MNRTPSLRTAAGLVALLAAAGCSMMSASQAGASSETESTQPAMSPDAAAQRVAQLVNQHRAQVGCPALVWDAGAARVAQAHSEDMRRRNFFSHTTPEGKTPFDRLDAAGIAWGVAAENIAQDPRGPDAVVRAWLASPGHRENIENCRLTRHGVGVSGDRWTHVFYTPR